MDLLENKLGKVLKLYRKKHGYTQEKAAEHFGISLIYYGEIERGNRYPQLPMLKGFSEKMNCPLTDLIDEQIPEGMDPESYLLIKEIDSILYESSPETIATYYEILKTLDRKRP